MHAIVERRAGAVRFAVPLALLAGAPAFSQEELPQATRAETAQADPAQTPQTASEGLQEVVVTAQFRAENLQETPIAITAVNAAMLEQRSQTNIAEVAAQAPNVTLKPAGAAFGSSLVGFIRGVGQSDYSFALEPGVGMYVDDVYYATLTGSVLDLLDLDRVEVLRGPQGTLAGKNSLGGAIKLYSKKPDSSQDGYVQATYGQYDRIDVRASGNFVLVPDKVFARISGVSKNRDGYVDRVDYACENPGSGLPVTRTGTDCKVGTLGGQSYSAARAALRWLPSDAVEVNLTGDVTNDKSESQASTILFANNPLRTLSGVPFDSRFVPSNPYVSYSTFADPTNPLGAYDIPVVNTLESWGVAGTIDWELSETLALKSISGYRRYEGDFAEDTDGSPIPVELVMNHVEHRAFTQELRLNGTTFGTAFDYTVGLFYLSADSLNSNRVNLPYVIPATDFVRFDFLSDDPVPAHTKAAFAHGVYHVTDQLDFTLGIRYTDEDKTYTFSRVNPDGTPSPFLGALDGVSGRYDGSKTDYRADVNYQWTPDLMTYVQFSTGFKGGGINPRPFFPDQVGPFGPETLEAYEIGLKSFLFDRSVRLNMAAFYNEYSDIQLTLLACPTAPCAKPTNGGDAEVKGAELEAEIHPLEGVLVDASVSYLDFKYKSLNPGVTGPGVGVQLGMVTPYTPEWKYSFGAQYALPLGNAGTITPRIDASYQSSIYTNVVNSPTNQIPSYTLYNARVTWDSASDDWQVAAEVTNLADKLYYLTLFDLSTIGAGYIAGQPGPPRQWGVTVKRKF